MSKLVYYAIVPAAKAGGSWDIMHSALNIRIHTRTTPKSSGFCGRDIVKLNYSYFYDNSLATYDFGEDFGVM